MKLMQREQVGSARPTRATSTECMLAMYLHDSDILLADFPSGDRLKSIANEALHEHGPTRHLSPGAYVRTMSTPGSLPMADQEARARRDAPGLLQDILRDRGLDPAGYEQEVWTEELNPEVRVVWASASRSETGEVPLGPTPLAEAAPARDDRSPPPVTDPPAELQTQATRSTTARDGVFGTELTDDEHAALDPVVSIATERADKLRRSAGLRWAFVVAMFVLAVGLPIVLGTVGAVGAGIAWAMVGGLLLVGFAATAWVGRVNRLSSGSICEEISAAIEAEGLPRWATVEALSEKLKGSITDRTLLAEIDADAAKVLELRRKGLEVIDGLAKTGVDPVKMKLAFDSSDGRLREVTVQGEDAAMAFRDLAAEYLEAGALCEALAAMALSATTYIRIAPPGMKENLALRAELHEIAGSVDLGAGGTVEVVGGALRPGASADIIRKTHGVFEGFTFDSEAKTVRNVLDKRRELSVLESLASMAKGGEPDSLLGDLAQALHKTRADVTKDPVFVTACVEHLAGLSPPNIRLLGLNKMCWIPDRQVMPFILELFGLAPFYAAGIDAVARFGSDVAPEVMRRFQHADGPNVRFNLALTLGILGYSKARPVLESVLDETPGTIEQLGCHYALARWGEESSIAKLISGLDDRGAAVRHAAAIAVEHLPSPIADDVYLRHLHDSSPLVRLRLLRKLRSQGTKDQKLAEMLVSLLADSHDDVRQAAVEAVGMLPAALVADRVIGLSEPRHEVTALRQMATVTRTRAAAVEAMSKFDDPRVEAILLKYAQAGPKEIRRAAIDGLGERGVDSAVESLVDLFADKASHYSDAARVALIRIGLGDPKKVLTALPSKRTDEIDGLRTVLGDQEARGRLVKKLADSQKPADLASVLMTARMLGGPEFEEPLRKLLAYRRSANFPGDRLVAHMAFGGLVQSLARRSTKLARNGSLRPSTSHGGSCHA